MGKVDPVTRGIEIAVKYFGIQFDVSHNLEKILLMNELWNRNVLIAIKRFQLGQRKTAWNLGFKRQWWVNWGDTRSIVHLKCSYHWYLTFSRHKIFFFFEEGDSMFWNWLAAYGTAHSCPMKWVIVVFNFYCRSSFGHSKYPSY